jgi:ribosomal protein S18 acetylase RimI-like enzyme
LPRTASDTDTSVVADVLARAFAHDPVLETLLGRRRDMIVALRRYFEIEARLAIGVRGEVWLDDDELAAAVWHRPAAWPEAAHIPNRLIFSYLRIFSRRFLLASQFATILARAHPDKPHWYLPFIGAVPEAAGLGRGSALLALGLSRCDSDGTGAYLEATSDASARLFARHGFQRLTPTNLARGVVVQPMWRDPGAA